MKTNEEIYQYFRYLNQKVTNVRQSLADATTINWNYGLGNCAVVSISGTRIVAITGMQGVCFGVLEVKHLVAGSALTLPGDMSTVKWNNVAGMTTLLRFYFNGKSFIWSSNA